MDFKIRDFTMSLSDLYLLLHIFFMIGIILLCAIAAMPTRYWMALAAWGRRRLLQTKGEKLQKALALQGAVFTADESFLDRGVGLAMDHKQGLVFLAQADGKQYRTAILSKAQLGAHTTIVRQDEGFHRCFVEILETGATPRKWLLPCADSDLADEINSRLSHDFA